MRKGFHVLILALGLAIAGRAQTNTGTVTGRVIDASGGAVPDAAVTLTNSGTQLALPTKTDSEGNYSFVAIRPGPYRVQVEKAGFQKFATQFELAVDQTARVDVSLPVGQVTNSVEVTERPVLVESETSSLGQVISSKQVADLPLNGRNPFALAALTPGVVPLGSFGVGLNATRSAAQMAGANNFMANGGIAGSNEVLLDGVPITVCCQGQPAIIPSVDVTQEFKVQTNVSSAEFGRTSGGILNIITKSGTNDLHGSGYEFFGNDQLSAANFFVNRAGKPPIPGRDDFRTPLRYNQYGFTLGGPVTIPKLYSGKDKTFFFGGYEATKVRQYNYMTSVVPPTSIRSGDLSAAPNAVYDPLSTIPDAANPGQYVRTRFQNN
ncbi:MAG TPA: carboxypeptidase-like regulatory domain-containing protein, partial [Bryobacteraceae bacterium]|nr:carboxypeptidase-like regulatory domain-containing protein [Bryobacteraceae bacterium]